MVLPLLAVMLIHGSYGFPNTFAIDQSPEDVCPLGVSGKCLCTTNADGTAGCCTTDVFGHQFCSKCDYDQSTGKYTNCQSVPSGKPSIPLRNNIPTTGLQSMPLNPGTFGGNSHGKTTGLQSMPLNTESSGGNSSINSK
ncbi:MAG: hypothetical protein ACTHJ7_04515 [Candidatus Nitrosocosmicus sp.]